MFKSRNNLSVVGVSIAAFLSCNSILAALDKNDEERIRAIAIEVAGYKDSIVPIGTIIPYAGIGSVPDGFIECNGQALDKKGHQSDGRDYEALYAVIGETYTPITERGKEKFILPDLSGRVLMGASSDAKVNISKREIGEILGSENHVLQRSELPSHDHGVEDKGHVHDVTDSKHSHNYVASFHPRAVTFSLSETNPSKNGHLFEPAPSVSETHKSISNIAIDMGMTGITIKSTGDGAAHNIIQPSLVIRYLIKWKGSVHSATPEAVRNSCPGSSADSCDAK